MSSKAYRAAYSSMTEKQRDIMHDLWMRAENHDGHAWNMYCDIEDAVAGIVKEQVPPAQPTLYGYDIKHLAFVASIMAKKGVSPEEAVTIFRDVNRVIEMMLEDMKEMQENALKQTLKKPWEGERDE